MSARPWAEVPEEDRQRVRRLLTDERESLAHQADMNAGHQGLVAAVRYEIDALDSALATLRAAEQPPAPGPTAERCRSAEEERADVVAQFRRRAVVWRAEDGAHAKATAYLYDDAADVIESGAHVGAAKGEEPGR